MPHHSISHQNTPDHTLVPWPPWLAKPHVSVLYLFTGNKALTINSEIGMSRGDVRETLEILEMIR